MLLNNYKMCLWSSPALSKAHIFLYLLIYGIVYGMVYGMVIYGNLR